MKKITQVAFAALFAFPVVTAIVHSHTAVAATDEEDDPGVNADEGDAQRTSGLPNFGREVKKEHHADVAPAPAPAPVAVVAPAPTPSPVSAMDRCKAVAISQGAVGEPCMTTAQFIRSLNLPKAEARRAVAMVKKADSQLSNMAH